MNHPAFKISDNMLNRACQMQNLEEALDTIMLKVGIQDGGAAGMVFTPDYYAQWPKCDIHDRLAMLQEWREAERTYLIDYSLH